MRRRTTLPHARRPSTARLALAVGALGLCASACGLSLYELPPPPPKAQWKTVSLIPGQEDRDSGKRYVLARATAFRLYSALASERWDEAWSLLSVETQRALSKGSPDGDGLRVLREGLYLSGKGDPANAARLDKLRFDPVDHFLVRDLSTFSDEDPNYSESESDRRKEIYAISRSGQSKRVVVIFEAGHWRIHKTGFEGTDLEVSN